MLLSLYHSYHLRKSKGLGDPASGRETETKHMFLTINRKVTGSYWKVSGKSLKRWVLPMCIVSLLSPSPSPRLCPEDPRGPGRPWGVSINDEALLAELQTHPPLLLCVVMLSWETTFLLCQMVLCEILAIGLLDCRSWVINSFWLAQDFPSFSTQSSAAQEPLGGMVGHPRQKELACCSWAR